MAKLSDLFGRGVLASRPAAGIAGRHYHSTDSTPPTTYRDNGSSWDSEATAGAAPPSYIDLPVGAAPADPAAGNLRLYAKTGGHAAQRDSAGVETLLDATGGGGGGAVGTGTAPWAIEALDRTTVSGLNGTFGDDFDGAALNGRWTRVVQAAGEETYQVGPRGSALRVAYATGAATRYMYQASPAGDWTFECRLTNWQAQVSNQMIGLLALDASGTGVAALMYDNPSGFYLANITAGAYASAVANVSGEIANRAGRQVWLRLRKATGLYAASYSFNGETYSPEISGTPTAFTLARVGLGRVLGTDVSDVVDWHWFDKTA